MHRRIMVIVAAAMLILGMRLVTGGATSVAAAKPAARKVNPRYRLLLYRLLQMAVPVAMVTALAAATAPAQAATSLPCDIYASNNTPCVAAYSMDRALYSSYDGPLYQVTRASDGTTANIGLLATGGYVDAAEQDSFCFRTSCTVTELYDQSPDGNNLTPEGAGTHPPADTPAPAAALPITVDGHEAYGLDIMGSTGYRKLKGLDTATGAEPESVYMVASGTHNNSSCCFDFGNAENTIKAGVAGNMDAVNLSSACDAKTEAPCTGHGPWVAADLEGGVWMGSGSNPADTGNNSPFVTAMLNNPGTSFQLEGGNAQSGDLTTFYGGPLPSAVTMGKMDEKGGIVLGTGGDNSHLGIGTFYEGVMTQGVPTPAAETAVQASIVSAGYSQVPSEPAGPAVVHDGYDSVYTVDASTGDLQETYLPELGYSWSTQDLSANYGTPPVMKGTRPVAVYHDGYTSVYTVDTNGDLQETSLAGIGKPWTTTDLSATAGTPTTSSTPAAVYHDGYTSVYTVDSSGGYLQETYLPLIGHPWSTQDLSAINSAETPPVLRKTSPVAVVHDGYTSVYTVDASDGDLQETYLPAIDFTVPYTEQSWSTQDLSANYGTPATAVTPAAVYHDGYTSVYTVDSSDGDLQETYLPAIGDPWKTQDLSASYGTPAVRASTAPAALYHSPNTSVYTVDASDGDLQETYLPAIGDPWKTQDLSASYGTPAVAAGLAPAALLHPDASGLFTYASVYTVDSGGDLQETYLKAIGDSWKTQDLSANYGTPPASG